MTDMEPDLNAMQADLRTLVETESPSSDPTAVARVTAIIEDWARDLGAAVHALPGGTAELSFGVQEGQKYLLILAHADTVWPHGTLAHMPMNEHGARLYGPGSYDMKGGIVGLFEVLRAMRRDERWPTGGVKVLVSPDEEIGSGSSRGHIEAAAQQARAVLVIEPPVADSHNLKTGRKGTGNYVLTLSGVASHAGNRPELGASAISAAAEAVLALEALADHAKGTTVSAGLIQGGSAANVIAASARLEVDVRVATVTEGERIDHAIRSWKPGNKRVRVEVSGGLNRPPFEESAATMQLFGQAQQIAADLGFQLGHEIVGGGSDGNFTAPIAPTLDGLGAPGDGAHASHEHIRLDRWADHVKMLHQLMLEV
ncbi:M20 family metallopeptidase [Deinococcus sp.]|uniref:M20 family metallopeptidase n=1 Tax=Deinococcus sp. TaxID=47478 RepID=UPI0025BA07DC|nr:M20 family metallopeptidase [Deinococcus sp.]